MKPRKLHPLIWIVLLGIVGFFSVVLLSMFRGIPSYSVEVTMSESIVSLFLLLALCLSSARIILWAYSRVQSPQYPVRVFGFGFGASIIIAVVTMGLGFLQRKYIQNRVSDQITSALLTSGNINFLLSGFVPVLFTCAAITITLLWIARWKKVKDSPAKLFDEPHRKHDSILALVTLIVYGFLMKGMLEFILSSLILIRF